MDIPEHLHFGVWLHNTTKFASGRYVVIIMLEVDSIMASTHAMLGRVQTIPGSISTIKLSLLVALKRLFHTRMQERNLTSSLISASTKHRGIESFIIVCDECRGFEEQQK